MAVRDWVATGAGLILASVGLTAFALSGPGTSIPGPEGTAPVPGATASTPAPIVVETLLPVPAPEVPGISDAVERVLGRSGYAESVEADRLGLPPAVIRVLQVSGVVLLLPEEAGP